MHMNRSALSHAPSPRQIEDKSKPFPASFARHIEVKRRLLFHKLVNMDERDFMIEISRTGTKIYVIAFNLARPDTGGKYSLEFTEK